MIGFFQFLVEQAAIAFTPAFFFCSAAAIYLLLRREVDQTGFDVIARADGGARFTLPALRPGAAGVPEVDPGEQ